MPRKSHPLPENRASRQRVFRLLLLYRWFSLIPPALTLLAGEGAAALALPALAAACAVNLFITFFPAQLNAALLRRPALLGGDLLFCGLLASLTGGWSTSYYLYSFSPLLVAAFFFQLRGALAAAAGMAGLFLAAGPMSSRLAGIPAGTAAGLPAEALTGILVWGWPWLVAQVVGFFLIAGAFGYATTLLASLQTSHAELDRAHRDLEVIHSLTLSLQSAADVNEVEERVLTAVTDDLGFPRAVIALVDQNEGVITAWLGRARDGQPMFAGALPHPARVPLSPAAGVIPAAVLDGQPRRGLVDPSTPDEHVNRNLRGGTFHLFPMLLRDHPVGVLLVGERDGEGRDPARLESLQSIASQAAVAVGTTMLCIDRAQRLAVQDERIRIAREIHDTVSQSLFGMSYTLNACARLLPEHPQRVKTELQRLTELAEAARGQLRQSILDIWPSEMTAESFERDLRNHAREHCLAEELVVEVQMGGDFQRLPARTRRGLYRIAQEAVANITRHAAATRAIVCLTVDGREALLTVRDNGRGFLPAEALARERDREHFGLRGMKARAASLGGECEFFSRPGAGACVLVSVPSD